MTPIDLPGRNVIFAEHQPEYQSLPAIKLSDGEVITCWQLSDDEIRQLVQTKKLFISQLTFNTPLQPILPSVNLEEFFELQG
jgi:hypothetical protein